VVEVAVAQANHRGARSIFRWTYTTTTALQLQAERSDVWAKASTAMQIVHRGLSIGISIGELNDSWALG
jgi:hypothetical protein